MKITIYLKRLISLIRSRLNLLLLAAINASILAIIYFIIVLAWKSAYTNILLGVLLFIWAFVTVLIISRFRYKLIQIVLIPIPATAVALATLLIVAILIFYDDNIFWTKTETATFPGRDIQIEVYALTGWDNEEPCANRFVARRWIFTKTLVRVGSVKMSNCYARKHDLVWQDDKLILRIETTEKIEVYELEPYSLFD